MRELLTYLGTQAAVGGWLAAAGATLLPALFVGLLAVVAVAGFRAVVRGDLL